MRGVWIAIAVMAIPMVAFADKSEPPTAAQKIQISCDFIEIAASKAKDPSIDGELKPMQNRLDSAFGERWNQFRLLSRAQQTLEKKQPAAIKLKDGAATATLIEIVDKSKARLTVEINDGKGKPLATQTQLVAGGDWVITVVIKPNKDGHLLAGSCK